MANSNTPDVSDRERSRSPTSIKRKRSRSPYTGRSKRESPESQRLKRQKRPHQRNRSRSRSRDRYSRRQSEHQLRRDRRRDDSPVKGRGVKRYVRQQSSSGSEGEGERWNMHGQENNRKKPMKQKEISQNRGRENNEEKGGYGQTLKQGQEQKQGQGGQNSREKDEEKTIGTRKPVLQGDGKTGGVYIPPFRLQQLMNDCSDKNSQQFQRIQWEALKKSLNGLVNKVNATNIRNILQEVFAENLIRGRGLICRSIMKAQAASPQFTDVFAALIAVINTKFPEIGELLLTRVILQFKRSYLRNDKDVCMAATKFLAHLVNQGVAHELLALQMLIMFLEQPSDDSVHLAVDFTKEFGATLQDSCPQGLHTVFERFRAILHEGQIDKKIQYRIEGLFAVRKAGFEKSGFPALKKQLDLIEADDQIMHEILLDSENLKAQKEIDVFKFDPEFEKGEQEYETIKKEIFGDDYGVGVSGEEGDGDSPSGEDNSDDSENSDDEQQINDQIQDLTETDLVNLRRTIYLTIMSSVDFEETGHKLMKIGFKEGQEVELCTMIIECCSQERTYLRYYGLLAERFCLMDRKYQECFVECFLKQYQLIHRLETNKLRNVAKFFAWLLYKDALPWNVLEIIRLTEDDTTSSSRIFIKILFQELSEYMGLRLLNERLQDPDCQQWFQGIFPADTQKNLRFAINFFTSIGLGGLTDAMRKLYEELPKILAERRKQEQKDAQNQKKSKKSKSKRKNLEENSSSSSSGSDSSSGDSDSESGSGGSSGSSDESGSDSSSTDDSDSSSGTDSD